MPEDNNNNENLINSISKFASPLNVISILSVILLTFLIYVFRKNLRDALGADNDFLRAGMYFIFGTIFVLFVLSILRLIIPQTLTTKIIEEISFTKILYALIAIVIGIFLYFSKDILVGNGSKTGEYVLIRLLMTLGIVATTSVIGIKLVFASLAAKDNPTGFKDLFQMAREVFTAFIAIVGTIMGFYYGNASSDGYKDQLNKEKTEKKGWIYVGKVNSKNDFTKRETISNSTKYSDLKTDTKIVLTTSAKLRKESNCPQSGGEIIDSIDTGETLTLLSDPKLCEIMDTPSTNTNSANVAETNTATVTNTEKESGVWVKVSKKD